MRGETSSAGPSPTPSPKGRGPGREVRTIPRIILVRHGQTDWNVQGRTQGWNDQPLNALGLRQAALVGEYLRGRFNPGHVWSSDLLRCTQTAEAIGLPFNRTEALREIRFGAWEGRPWMDLHREAPELLARFVRGDPSFRAPGGETLGELVERMGRFARESGILAAEGDVAIIGHGGAMRALIVSLLGLPPEATARFHCGNCTVSVIASSWSGPLRLESLNESAHLDGGSG